MVYTEDTINKLFEECIALVDSCIFNCEIEELEDVKSILYLSFAGFLVYYGYEYMDIIYDCFDNTSFVFEKESLHLNKYQVIDNMPAFVKVRYYIDDSKVQLEDYVYMTKFENIGLRFGLNFFIHEMNHLINSRLNRVINGNMVRSGISLYDISKNIYINQAINEAFNTLQTSQIEEVVYSFLQYKITTPYFYSILEKLFHEEKNDMYVPYPVTTHIISPLFQNEKFKSIYEKRSIDGDILSIFSYFDEKTYENAFSDLSMLIQRCNNDIGLEGQRDVVLKAKRIVKTYLDS